jgi:hypothetical protein
MEVASQARCSPKTKKSKNSKSIGRVRYTALGAFHAKASFWLAQGMFDDLSSSGFPAMIRTPKLRLTLDLMI